MIVVPAIDLKDGNVVRLIKGDFAQETVFGEDPVAQAKQWEALGGQRLHVVDLNGALEGAPQHLPIIQNIVQALSIPVQIGGGIRSFETIEQYINVGINRVILGTKACLDEAFFGEAVSRFGDHIAAAIDVKDGFVATKGWVETSEVEASGLIDRLLAFGTKTFIYTDISKDGTLDGPNIEAYEQILKQTGPDVTVVASGGISKQDDLVALSRLTDQGLREAIVGRALYDGKVNLPEAIEACQ